MAALELSSICDMPRAISISQATLFHSENHWGRNGAVNLECRPGFFETAFQLYSKTKSTVEFQSKRVMVIDGMFVERNVLYLLQMM